MQWMGGPQYCETPVNFAQGLFPVEPFNTYSNLSIIFFALAGFYLVVRRAPRAIDLYFLCAVLLVNGVGSFLWHGLRDWTALRIEVLAGLLFLIGLFFLWARRVMPLWQAGVFGLTFYLGTAISDQFDLIPYGRWASMLPAVIVFGSYLIYRSGTISRPAAYLGIAALISSTSALAFRTIDRENLVCDFVPFGTHFLWHIFLSTGAFLGMLAMLSVIRAGRAAREYPAREPVGAPAV